VIDFPVQSYRARGQAKAIFVLVPVSNVMHDRYIVPRIFILAAADLPEKPVYAPPAEPQPLESLSLIQRFDRFKDQ
jgi:hypothetical protein